jgi:putative hydrolase of HD superfamily
MASINRITDYLFALDSLKAVNRRTYIHDASRVENSAEHSWHLAMACWTFAEFLDQPIDMERLLKLALIHDLGEIDAGDTFLYASSREGVAEKERAGVKRLADHSGNPVATLLPLWDEQELGTSQEAKLMKVMDRLLPFLCNIKTRGKAWTENGVVRSQVAAAHAFIEQEIPDLHVWMTQQLEIAVAEGWLAE